ncbi:MAG: Sapep family Mn(2+)-dependent dipeptidase [Clostridia bacterium]|nr:Sapep family Mn(2+)-dependent dipeptidase [Clostridia bacterium]
MKEELISKIDELIENIDERLIEDTIRLVNINSEQGEAKPGAPFGEGPRKVLDEVLSIGNKDGFFTTDYNVGVISLAMKEGEPDLGVWIHGDIVPAGDGWNFEPYKGTFYKNCIIGRGAADNKGQLATLINLFRIFKELGIGLNYNPAIYVGSNEETGMRDIKGIKGNPDAKGFMNVCKFPRLSLVPDSSFPVGYGARGLNTFKIKSKKPLKSLTLTAGLDETPGSATAILEGTDYPDKLPKCKITKEANKTIIETYSPPRHTSKPDPDGNMITFIADALLENNLVCGEDRHILELFRDASINIHGETFDIDVTGKDPKMGRTITYAKTILNHDGYVELELKVRYPIDITYEEIKEKMEKVCEERGLEVNSVLGNRPYINDDKNEVVKTLTKIANEIKGTVKEPYICGSTYGHYVPNAYAFGMDGNCPPEDFPQGRGGAHGVDEAVSIVRLKEAMKIYARALLALNEINW